jgi:hypothetical protein
MFASIFSSARGQVSKTLALWLNLL